MPSKSLAQRTRMRLVPAEPFDSVRLYGPNEVPHPFAVTEMIVRNSRGEVVKVLREKRGEWIEVAS